MFVERTLFVCIQAGIDYAKANPDALLTFFERDCELSVDEATKIRDLFLKQPPTVKHGYARADSPFPLFSITLTGDSQAGSFLGDEGDVIDDPGALDDGEMEYASLKGYTYNIFVYATHPDVTLYYHHLLESFVQQSLPLLKVPGNAYGIQFSSSDMAPDEKFAPAGLFVRRLQLSLRRPYSVPMLGAFDAGRAFKVRGVHVDAAGDPGEDVGGVPTNVKVEP